MIEAFEGLITTPSVPSWHVLVIHFPIALICLAPVFDLACLVFRSRVWLDRAAAAFYVMGTIGATFYLIGVGFLYMATGSLNTMDIAARVGDVNEVRLLLVAAGFITVGMALKAAVFPLHSWMPNAYTFAPNVVTVFIAAASAAAW